MEGKNYSITKLNGENYYLWRLKMEMVLQKEKIWSAICDMPPSPLTEDWKNKDMASRATIGLSIEDQILMSIGECKTAKDLWEGLQRTYQHTNLTCKLTLLRKLYGCKLTDYHTMEEYLNKIKELTGRLRSSGEIIKPHHIVAVMLGGLPASYSPMISAIEAKEEEQLTPENVSEKLRDEDSRRRNMEGEEERHDLAMKASNKEEVKAKSNRITCFGCGMEGHIKRNCDARRELRRDERWNKNDRSHLYTRTDRSNNMYMVNETGDSNNGQVIELQDEWALIGPEEGKEVQEDEWIIDSGASSHMTSGKNFMYDIKTLPKPIIIKLANGSKVEATSLGKVDLTSNKMRNSGQITLSQVLLVPGIEHNLLSVKKLGEDGFIIAFDHNSCRIMLKNEVIMTGITKNNVYVVEGEMYTMEASEVAEVCIHEWHRRMGHRSLESLKHMVNKNLVKNLKITKCAHLDFCETCQLTNLKQRSFKSSTSYSREPFELIFSDVCGPIEPMTLGGNRYILTLTDNYSRFTHVEVIASKHQVTEKIINYMKSGKNKFKHFPQVFRSDGGGEYCNKKLETFLKDNGIIHQTTIPETPMQNGRSERLNGTLLRIMRNLMKYHKTPLFLWGEAAKTAAYLYNRSNHRETSFPTPFELWNKMQPDVAHLRTFGSEAYAHISKSKQTKLGDRSQKGIMVGYCNTQKGYRIWIPGSKKIINSTSIAFNEKDNMGEVREENQTSQEEVTIPLEWLKEKGNIQGSQEGFVEIRKSERINKGIPPNRLTM